MVKGGYYHAGQVCVSTQRIFVHEKLFDEFVTLFTERVQKLRAGNPLLPDIEVGPLILPREVVRVESWVHEAVTSGGTVSVGGKRLGDRLFQPTVILEPSAGALLSRQEVFGPVTAVYRFSNLSSAVEEAGSLPYTFHASVFASDISAALRAASSLNASAVMINDMTAFRTDWMPFSGWAQSGLGTGGIGHSMREMTREKTIVLKR
jgi:acyl-CoA reductase-like NAD-dependent aldehyde dehydrogenase